jgi:hypothetical protein
MMNALNLRLIFPVIFLLLSLIISVASYAAEAQKVESVQSEPLLNVSKAGNSEQENKAIVFLELFSSQACVFCPQADRLFSDLLEQSNIVGVSCHVDYFRVRKGSLAKPFCTDRQSWYMKTLGAGPNYTPQLVVNGHHDVVGYKIEKIVDTLKQAEQENLFILNIVPGEQKGMFNFMLPKTDLKNDQEAKIWLLVYDRPHVLNIADGHNLGKSMNYINIVSHIDDLGPWDGSAVNKNIIPVVGLKQKGFIVLVQDVKSGSILALGSHEIVREKEIYGPYKP